jgi:hypothetical protein
MSRKSHLIAVAEGSTSASQSAIQEMISARPASSAP